MSEGFPKTAQQTIEEAVKKLPDSVPLIQEKLIELGITGQICSALRCPIARFLQKEVDSWDVSVGSRIAAYYNPQWEEGIVEVPPAVRAFIIAFDQKHLDPRLYEAGA